MKKILFLLLLTFGFANAQILTIPDANFKNKLVNTLCVDTNNDGYGDAVVDTNNDGEIQNSEAEAVINLNIYFPNFTPLSDKIVDLTGINSFINLERLECGNNNLGNLDLTGLPNLKTISCMSSNISALNITGLINLEFLYCDYNQISVLNLAGLNNLQSLSCYNNQLSALNLTGLTNLIGLECSNNNITNLNLSSTPNLVSLRCSDNLLNTLNINFLTNLTQLEYGNLGLNNVAINNLVNVQDLFITGGIQNAINLNPLVALNSLRITNTNFIEIDVSNLQYLNRFYAYINYSLNNVNIKNGNNFNPATGGNGIYIENNPNLNFICADENNIVYINEHLATQNNTTIQVNSYCNFTPGGDYNTITGSMIFDENNNGCDASDLPQPNIKININDGTNQGATFTNTSGNYSFFTQTGSFTLTPAVENPSWFNFSPTSATIPFADNNNNLISQNFCLSANGIHNDLEIVIVPIIPARPGFDAVYKIVYKNKGNQTDTGYVNFTYNDAVLDFVSSSIVTNNNGGGFMNWIIANIAPFQSGSILVTLNVNSPQETPSVNIGDVLAFNAFIDVSTDDIWADNNFDFNQTVVGSYDPNDITCLQGNSLVTTEMGKYLHYNIRFENTGTAPAENIVVKNTIDLTQYNIQSLQVMESSHPMEVKVTGNIAEFIFQNIDLDTGGHGNILLKLKSNNSLPNDLVINDAEIFFDYNFPIITNEEQTVFADLSKNDFVKDVSIQVYPNPANDIINVKADNTINSIQLYDAQGRLLLTKIANENTQVLDLSSYSSGIYFINISTKVGKQTQKIIKK